MERIQPKQPVQTQCAFCAFSIPTSVIAFAESYDALFAGPVELRAKSVLIADCANAHSSVCGLSETSAGKNVRLLRAHIRDHLVANLLSYVDALVNLADVGAKVETGVARWRNFVAGGMFNVGFLGRIKARESNI